MRIPKIGFSLILFAFVTAGTNVTVFGQFREVPPKYEELHLVCLLGFPSIREHLSEEFNLSDDVIPALKELGRIRLENMHRRRDLRLKSRKMSDNQFTQSRIELMQTIEKANSENWDKAQKLLTEDQIARLKQLRIQRLGVAALMDQK